MADPKLTDLSELTAFEEDDLLYVVDISDTTDSAVGTSKKAQQKNVRGKPQTALEATLSITVVNPEYDDGDPNRYATNTTPGTTLMTTAVQTAINYLSHAYKVVDLGPDWFLVGKLYFHYDVVNNTGYNSDESKRGRWGFIGSGVQTASNMKNDHDIGTLIESNLATGIPFIAEPLGGDATVFPNRGLYLENIQAALS
jgi:hypothetical protein